MSRPFERRAGTGLALAAWLTVVPPLPPSLPSGDAAVMGHLQALRDELGDPAAATLDAIEDPGRRLLAARSYVRAGAGLKERWSWSREQIDAYQASPEKARLEREVALVRQAFEAANPGYTLYVNPQVRSLQIQLERWRTNESVGEAAAAMLESVRAAVGSGDFPAPATQEGRARFRRLLRGHTPKSTPMIAAPGLSPHGQARAVDFQVQRGSVIVAGARSGDVRTLWVGEGWGDRLRSAVSGAAGRFVGPLESPDEPWHFEYRP